MCSFDEWRCSTLISSTSKTIITEEPVAGALNSIILIYIWSIFHNKIHLKICEYDNLDVVDSLRAYCEVANFSSSSRLDSIVANLVPETITQVNSRLYSSVANLLPETITQVNSRLYSSVAYLVPEPITQVNFRLYSSVANLVPEPIPR